MANAIAKKIEPLSTLEEKFLKAFMYSFEHFQTNPVSSLILDSGHSYLSEAGYSRQSMSQFALLAFHDAISDYPSFHREAEGIAELWVRGVMSFLTMPDQCGGMLIALDWKLLENNGLQRMIGYSSSTPYSDLSKC